MIFCVYEMVFFVNHPGLLSSLALELMPQGLDVYHCSDPRDCSGTSLLQGHFRLDFKTPAVSQIFNSGFFTAVSMQTSRLAAPSVHKFPQER